MLTYIKYLTKQKQGITPQYMNTSKHAVQIIPISILFFVLVLNARELSQIYGNESNINLPTATSVWVFFSLPGINS